MTNWSVVKTMYSANHTNQNGSVAVFLIVSIVLAAAVIGGVYIVQQRGNQVRTVQPVAQQPTPTVTQEGSDSEAKKQEETKRQQEAAKQAEEAKKAAEEAQKKKQQEQATQAAKEQAAKEEAQKRAQQQTNVPQTSTAPAQTVPSATGNEHLPTTGPVEDSLTQLLAAGIMIIIIGAYLRSYKHRFGSIIG